MYCIRLAGYIDCGYISNENDQQILRIHVKTKARLVNIQPEFWLILITQPSRGRVGVEPDLRSADVSAVWNSFTLLIHSETCPSPDGGVSSFYIVTRGLQRYLR